MLVEGDGSNSVARDLFGGEDLVRFAAGGFFFRDAQVLDFARNDELGVVDEFHAELLNEALRAFGDEIDVHALFQHLAGGDDGVADSLDAPNASGAQRGAAHHRGIELHASVGVEEAAAPGIEGLVIFHHDDGGFHGLDGTSAALEHLPSSSHGVADTVDVRVDEMIGNGPGTAMDQQNRLIGQAASSPEATGYDTTVGGELMKFAKVVFWIAAVWGFLVLTPLFFMFDLIGKNDPPAITHPGFFYGFVTVGLAWQVAFVVIARDPLRMRPMMIPAVLEKFGYVIVVLAMYAQARMKAQDLVFAFTDGVLVVMFAVAYARTKALAARTTAT